MRLARVFAQISEADRAVELSRQVLAEQIDFEPYSAFKRLDRDAKGYLIAQDLVDFMRDNNYACTQHEGYLLLRVYDQNGNGRISYNEFMEAILPHESSALRNIAIQRQTYYVGPQDFLVYDVEFALCRIFEKELDQFQAVETVKRDLADRYDFYFHAAYRLVEQDSYGIGSVALGEFLNKNGFILSDGDIDSIIRRFDSTGDARISYSEFCDKVLPYEPAYHHYPRYRYYRYYPLRNYYDDSYSTRMYRSTLPLSARGRTSYGSPSRMAQTSRSFHASPSRTSRSFMASPSRTARSFIASPSRTAYASRSFAVSPGRALSTSPNRSTLSPTRSPVREEFTTPTKSPGKSFASYSAEKQSPLREEDEDELMQTLKTQIKSERELESIKQSLALQSDFNLLDAFRLFDTKGRGWITSSELESGMKEFGVYPTRDEVYLFMRRLDRDSDGRVRYSDFCDVLTPKQSEYSSLMNKRIPHNADLYYDSYSVSFWGFYWKIWDFWIGN